MQIFTADVITWLCLGKAFGCIENARDQYGFLEAVRIGSAVSQQFWVMHEINRLLFHLTKIPSMRRRIVPFDKVIGVNSL